MLFKKRKSILFFPINGSGIGHLNRCLAYARRMPKSWKASFFSLSTAIGAVEKMGFAADYFVSHFWTANSGANWNRELAARLGLMLEHARPDVLLFDGTYPYVGLRRALRACKRPVKLVWSRRGLSKTQAWDSKKEDCLFHLLVQPGELDAELNVPVAEGGDTPGMITPPVTLFDREELLPRNEARRGLGLRQDKKYILFSTGPGNLKDVSGISHRLLAETAKAGFEAVWLQSPIAVRPLEVPAGVQVLEKYPVARHLGAFDGFVTAAGYNSSHEAAMCGVPTLFLPNEKLSDNQLARAMSLARRKFAVICVDDGGAGLERSLDSFFGLVEGKKFMPVHFANGAYIVRDAITALVD